MVKGVQLLTGLAVATKLTSFDQLADSQTDPLKLTVVIPTYNERQNVPILLAELERELYGIEWEAVFVDDHSPDGTSEVVREVARNNRRVRLIERIGRRGLSSACIEGMMASAAPYIAVMDGDLQHDEAILPEMLRRIEDEELDVVVASRRVTGGSMGEFAKKRIRLSNLGTRISSLICRCEVSDAMSGFFIVESGYFRELAPRLTGTGFKILIDILASSDGPPRVTDVPYCFANRQFGDSKLDVTVKLEYLYLILDKLVGKYLTTRLVLFLLVGAIGVLAHLAILAILYLNRVSDFTNAQAIATVVAMTCNFLLNNLITLRDRRLRGRRLAAGLLKIYAVYSLGAVFNVAVATMLYHRGIQWYVAGAAGIAISSFWNYNVNTVLTWRRNLS
jgi:dolichol-phosphate mannosyltransferase